MNKLTDAEKIFLLMLLYVAERYIREQNPERPFKNLEEIFSCFNDDNDFSQEKCELFPYLVMAGSPRRIELLQLFTPFTIFSGTGFKSLALSGFFEHQALLQILPRKNFTKKLAICLKDTELSYIQDLKTMTDLQIEESLSKQWDQVCRSLEIIENHKIKGLSSLRIALLSYWHRKNSTYGFFFDYFDAFGSVKESCRVPMGQLLEYLMRDLTTGITDLQAGKQEYSTADFLPIRQQITEYLSRYRS